MYVALFTFEVCLLIAIMFRGLLEQSVCSVETLVSIVPEVYLSLVIVNVRWAPNMLH